MIGAESVEAKPKEVALYSLQYDANGTIVGLKEIGVAADGTKKTFTQVEETSN